MGVQIPPSAPDLKKASFAGLFRTTREVLAPRLSELSELSPETDFHMVDGFATVAGDGPTETTGTSDTGPGPSARGMMPPHDGR